jgi:cell division protein FtsB
VRLIFFTIAALLVLIQYPLWLGKGGWLRVWELDNQVTLAKKKNIELRTRNAKLDSEVRDLTAGTEAMEERARYELGMIKDNEIFVRLVEAGKLPIAEPAPETPAANPVKPASLSRPRR